MRTRFTAPHRPAGLLARLHRRTQRAFTLVEVMMATLVFTMGILCVYAMMIKSYELVTLSRHRDNARAILQSFSDQFLRLQTTDANPNPSLPAITRPLFSTTGTPGDGLIWTDSNGTQYGADTPSRRAGPMIPLGDPNHDTSMVMAHLTRTVSYLDSAGNPVTTNTQGAAGWLLQGTFTIEYPINGRMQTQSITVTRRVP
jgi:prepilin-type N-terminal cleavage/methylation domain-containing protein